MEESCGDLPKLVSLVNEAVKATIMCYDGDCSKCRRHSLVCGGGQRNSWWERSAFLGPHNVSVLRMTENDKVLLEEVLRLRLGEEALESTQFGYNTQTCESFNYSLSKSAPKNVNYSRNFKGRCSSAVLRHNNGQADALIMKLECMGVHLSPGPARALNKIGKDMRVHREYNKSFKTKARKIKRRGTREWKHRLYRQQKNRRQADYVSSRRDHAYTKA